MTVKKRLETAIKQTIGKEIISLLEDDSVTEIMRNANGSLCIERLGQNIMTSSIKLSDSVAESLIKFFAASQGEICNDKKPSLAIKLPYWQARFQGLLPPVVDAPSFSIRKHNKYVFTLESYLKKGELTQKQFEAIVKAIENRKNIVISGGTGSGKTTLANAILQKMTETGDRIITVEDTPELIVNQGCGLQIFTKEIIGYDARRALKDILRLRPDRIVVGELRDGACLDLIKAWNTGHSGGLATIHANSCELALERAESLISEVSMSVPRRLMAQTIDLVIQVERQGFKRSITDIKHLIDFDSKQQIYNFCDIGGNYAQSTKILHFDNPSHSGVLP